MDVLVLETQEQIVAVVKGQDVMKEIVEVGRLIPQECVQRAVEEIVDILVGVMKGIPQERVPKRIAEQIVDLRALQIMKETTKIARSIPPGVRSTHRGTRCGCARISGPGADRARWQKTLF